MNWDYYSVELNPHDDDPDLVHVQLCVPSATALRIISAMEDFPTNSDLAVDRTISALRNRN
jgi:hypothetical protein